MKNTPICILCTGFATVTTLLLLKNIGYDMLDDESPTGVCSPSSARKGSFPSVNRRAERQVQRNVEEDEPIRLPSVGLHESYGVKFLGLELRKFLNWKNLN